MKEVAMNIGELIYSFEGCNLTSRIKVLVAVDRNYRAGEVVELEIAGIVNRGELASDGQEGDCSDAPETLRTGCAWDDTFIVSGEQLNLREVEQALVDAPATTQVDNQPPVDDGDAEEEDTRG